MSYFATEFPVKPSTTQAMFAALAIAWARGMTDSDLFSSQAVEELENDHAVLMSENGETLALKQCDTYEGFVIGVRYEKPDDEGLKWRSEIVLTNRGDAATLRVKAQCLSMLATAKPRTPRKPYFIKMAIQEGWTDIDGVLPIVDEPLCARDIGIDLVAKAICGKINAYLPIIYISASFSDEDRLPDHEVSKAAFRMGGVAHIIVEPNRDFSNSLMELTAGENPYGGTIALMAGDFGVLSRLYRGGRLASNQDVLRAVCSKATSYTSSRQAKSSWDWQDLLEESSRQLRAKVTDSSVELEEWHSIIDQQIRDKDQRIKELEAAVEEYQNAILEESNDDGRLLSAAFARQLGAEIYKGEFSDRTRLALSAVLSNDKNAIDERTRFVAEMVLNNTQFSGGARGLEARIKVAGNTSGKADVQMISILEEIGFTKRVDGGHPVMSPPESLKGLKSQTFSTSPSDYRAGKNKASQVINALHLKRLT